jgi:hypothetical protein
MRTERKTGKVTPSEVAEKTPFERDREGHDFNRAVKPLKMHPRFSAGGTLFAGAATLLRDLFRRAISGCNRFRLQPLKFLEAQPKLFQRPEKKILRSHHPRSSLAGRQHHPGKIFRAPQTKGETILHPISTHRRSAEPSNLGGPFLASLRTKLALSLPKGGAFQARPAHCCKNTSMPPSDW